ncbi:Brp/Blh family beta-carotene 15,15'-dioxygenase, partial [Sphingomonas sp.]|uniref:Brp/Blh family beta-carotene 15,15'-dioxygenase n=1 Tax=Sphingomonas sp. TaxID=28214 RepID=UPI0035C7D080
LVYCLVALTTLLWWTTDPAVALPAFLLASAFHFGVEDAPDGTIGERVARGTALVAGPAALHATDYAELLRVAGGPSSSLPGLAPVLAGAGGLACGIMLLLAVRRRDLRLALGMVALLCLPPLVGFTLGFLILHALPQTIERRDRLGCATTASYLRSVAPVFGGALLATGLIVALLLHVEPSGVRGLFAAIASLAIPHLLVTPWFEARQAVGRPARAADLTC